MSSGAGRASGIMDFISEALRKCCLGSVDRTAGIIDFAWETLKDRAYALASEVGCARAPVES